MNIKNILVVEDDNIIAMEIQARLEEQGYNVLGPFAYGEEVIDNIGKLNVDLILMDITLKGQLDGIETAQIIKEKFQKPVIYLTAYTDKATLERAKITEPFGYIIKPFEERELITNIEMALYKHKTELKLIESEIRYRRLHESMTDCFAQCSMSGHITDVNQSFLNMTGYNREEIIGLKYTDITPEIWWDFEQKIIDTQLLPLGYSEIYEKEYISKIGTVFPVELKTYLLKDLQGNPSFMCAVIRDITERKSIEKEIQLKNIELAKINASKDKFFSIIAHDLKSPFNGFLGLTKLMVEEIQDLTIEEIKLFAKNMLASAKNLFQLLENLLEWSQMQRGMINFNPELIDLSGCIKQNINIIQNFSNQKKIEIINHIDEEIIIVADKSMVNTILRNIFSNAVKFSRRNGKIDIGLGKHCNVPLQNVDLSDNISDVVIYIKDNGIGMNQMALEKLFKIEEKLSHKGTEGEAGTGLGLILCKEFAEQNGGKIWVESEFGLGTTFYFSVPRGK